MTNLVILSATERTLFDEPPKLTAKDRSLYFLLTNDILKIVKGLRSPETKIGFVLQLGYFRSNAKFLCFIDTTIKTDNLTFFKHCHIKSKLAHINQ